MAMYSVNSGVHYVTLFSPANRGCTLSNPKHIVGFFPGALGACVSNSGGTASYKLTCATSSGPNASPAPLPAPPIPAAPLSVQVSAGRMWACRPCYSNVVCACERALWQNL